jgi:hypothetical protein
MSIRGLMGDMELKEVSGDLSIREAGSVTIDTIHADFNLRGAKKDLYVKHVQGDVSIRDVEGHVTLDSVADDLALRGTHGNIKVNVGRMWSFILSQSRMVNIPSLPVMTSCLCCLHTQMRLSQCMALKLMWIGPV